MALFYFLIAPGPKALPVPSIRAGRSCPRWLSPGSGAGPDHAGAPAEHPGHPGGPQRPQEAAGRAGAAARLSARRRGRTCPGSAAAAPINHPRAEGAAGALDPRRAQLPALDLSRIRSRPGHAGAPAEHPGHPGGPQNCTETQKERGKAKR